MLARSDVDPDHVAVIGVSQGAYWIPRALAFATAATLRFRGKPYGAIHDSRYDLYRAVSAYKLGDELQRIDTPLLITEPQGEQSWPGQSQQLYDRVAGA